MQLILSDIVPNITQPHGICYVKSWPKLTTGEMGVFTNDGCIITKYPLNYINTYTMAIIFMLDNITSSCSISCWTQFNIEVKNVDLSKC